jgi:hypothetical protein
MSLVARPAPTHAPTNGTTLERRNGARHDADAAPADKDALELGPWSSGGVDSKPGEDARRRDDDDDDHGDRKQRPEEEPLAELEPTLSAMSAADRARGPVARAWMRHVSVKVPRAKMRDHLGGFFYFPFPPFFWLQG